MKRNRDIYGHTAPSNIAFAEWLEKNAEMPNSYQNGNDLWEYYPAGEQKHFITLQELHDIWLGQLPYT